MYNSSNKLENILYIYDEDESAQLLRERLESLYFKIDIAQTGEEGIQKLKQKHYDLVLVDSHLPGMSGIDIIAGLYGNPDYPPVILLAAIGDERIALKALESGASNYIIKDDGQFYLDILPTLMHKSFNRNLLRQENKRQQHELAIAQKAKSEFLATMSHEIRTPMNAVMGISRLLTLTKLDDKQREMINMLSSSADILMKLINNLLDIGRIEVEQISFENEPFSISAIFKDIQTAFDIEATDKRLELSFMDLTEGNLLIGDAACLHKILSNLVSNALKFTPEGRVNITASIVESNGAQLLVEVTDTGIGISSEKFLLIFDKFSQVDQTITRKFGGSGLGLTICKILAKQMGGDVTVESKVNSGSTFSLILPIEVISKKESMDPVNDITNIDFGGKGKILLVEDYPPNIMVAMMMLENLGFTVDSVESGPEALQKVQETNEPYTAILMDVQMRDMDGFETTRRIRSLEKNRGFQQPILGVTAHALAGDRERCLEAGMDDYMRKPIHPDMLEKKLVKLIKVMH